MSFWNNTDSKFPVKQVQVIGNNITVYVIWWQIGLQFDAEMTGLYQPFLRGPTIYLLFHVKIGKIVFDLL